MFHKNSQKRFYEEGVVYFVTVKTFESFTYFKEEIFCDLWIEELKLCKEVKRFKVFGFCLNYDHFHLLIQPQGKDNISKIMQFLKRNFSRDVNKIVCNEGVIPNYTYNNEGAIPNRANNGFSDSVSIGNNIDYRLQEFYIQLMDLQKQFNKKHGENLVELQQFKWQKSFHDHIIRNQEDFKFHWNYTVYNFKKHKLPESWKYTSLYYPEIVDELE